MSKTLDGLSVEITIRKYDAEANGPEIESIRDLMTYDTDGKMVFRVPVDWPGFKNGLALRLMKYYGESILFALSYFTLSDSVRVIGIDGKPVPAYPSTVEGQMGKRYNKKMLTIITLVNESERIYRSVSYILNMRFADPVVKIMESSFSGTEGYDAAWQVIKSLETSHP